MRATFLNTFPVSGAFRCPRYYQAQTLAHIPAHYGNTGGAPPPLRLITLTFIYIPSQHEIYYL